MSLPFYFLLTYVADRASASQEGALTEWEGAFYERRIVLVATTNETCFPKQLAVVKSDRIPLLASFRLTQRRAATPKSTAAPLSLVGRPITNPGPIPLVFTHRIAEPHHPEEKGRVALTKR